MSNATLTNVDDADKAIKYTCSDGGAWMAETSNSTYDESK